MKAAKIVGGAPNDRKQWIEGIWECITFIFNRLTDDEQPNNNRSVCPRCDDPVSQCYPQDRDRGRVLSLCITPSPLQPTPF